MGVFKTSEDPVLPPRTGSAVHKEYSPVPSYRPLVTPPPRIIKKHKKLEAEIQSEIELCKRNKRECDIEFAKLNERRLQYDDRQIVLENMLEILKDEEPTKEVFG